MPKRTEAPPREQAPAAGFPLSAPLLFVLIFSLLWILHLRLLPLPYFWDEAGYFVPAARDLLLTGDPIPRSTLSNSHPPLVMLWLAFWWKLVVYTPVVTRTAMLLVSAFTLLGVFRLARAVSNSSVAAASTLLTAVYPVFFAQSSLAHLDMMAAGLTMWGLLYYLEGKRTGAIVWFGFAGLAKETALLVPGALLLWEVLAPFVMKNSPRANVVELKAGRGGGRLPHSSPDFLKTLTLALSMLPLAAWLSYYYARTGLFLGNPEYVRYNFDATLHPARIILALVDRLWQLLGYLNMFVLTGAMVLAMGYSPLPSIPGAPKTASNPERPRIAPATQLVFAAVITAYVLALSFVGGAVLARYLLPVYPLVVIEGVATLWRRVSWWKIAVAAIALAFVAGWFVYPLYRFAPEDNLAYADDVRLHQAAIARLAELPSGPVLTAWPATDELQNPALGYVGHALKVVPAQNFGVAELSHAQTHPGRFDYVLLFSRKYEPPARRVVGWWEHVQARYFTYHQDLSPQAATEILGAKTIYFEQRGGEWVAILAMPQGYFNRYSK
jgi:hypothetical protein